MEKRGMGSPAKYGVSEKIAKLLKAVYQTVSAGVKIDDSILCTGFRQGCVLSPTLFNVVLDNVMRQLLKNADKKRAKTLETWLLLNMPMTTPSPPLIRSRALALYKFTYLFTYLLTIIAR